MHVCPYVCPYVVDSLFGFPKSFFFLIFVKSVKENQKSKCFKQCLENIFNNFQNVFLLPMFFDFVTFNVKCYTKKQKNKKKENRKQKNIDDQSVSLCDVFFPWMSLDEFDCVTAQ